MRVVVLADTHAPRRWKVCPPAVASCLRGAGLILHAGRPDRLRRFFPGAALVVFGHSHIPMDHTKHGQRIFNPGSPTDRRRQPRGTVGLLDIADGELIQAQIVAVT